MATGNIKTCNSKSWGVCPFHLWSHSPPRWCGPFHTGFINQSRCQYPIRAAVLVNVVPLLDADLLPTCTTPGGHQSSIRYAMDGNVPNQLLYASNVPWLQQRHCAAMSFFRSAMVSSGLHFTRIFRPMRSLQITCTLSQARFWLCGRHGPQTNPFPISARVGLDHGRISCAEPNCCPWG